ncbi:MAG: enoyl-CoA hydratase/isomerase family protein [Spongiibacter sp.]|nr:enoyl-CoA hydratase/isomerase family protein [Spongiibacter sp.]
MSYTACKVAIDDNGIATLTMSRPEIHNAFDDKVIAELRHILSDLATQDSVRVLVLAAEGKSFSAGADASWMRRMAGYSHAENRRDAQELAGLMQQLDRFPSPTVAKVQGAAFGGGVGLVACCDFAIANRRASFCLSEVKIGLIPATISPYVIAAIGPRAARRYAISAERFGAEQAEQLGLVSQCVDDDQLDDTVAAFCSGLLNNSPAAMRAAKTLIQDYQARDIDNALIQDSCTRIANIRVSPEGQEGLSAFLEKRQASWIRKHNNV